MSDPTPKDEISYRDRLSALRPVVSYRPGLTTAIVGLSIAVGTMEGIGLGFILPVIAVAQGGLSEDPSAPMELFVAVYDAVGIPFTLEYIVLGLSAVIGVRYGLGIVVAWLSAILENGYRRHLRVTGYDLALDARTSYFDDAGSEELLNAILTQTSYASRVIAKLVRGLVFSLVSLAYASVAFYIAPELMLATAGVLCLALVGTKFLFESGFDVGSRVAEANERVQTSLQAGIQGIRDVKLFGLGDELRADFGRAVDVQTRASIKKYRDQTALANLNNFFASVTVFGLVYLGVRSSALSLASLGVFLFAMFRLAPRLSSLNQLAYDINNDIPHLVRTQAFLDRLAEHTETWGDDPVPAPVDRVEFRDVDFTYPTDDTQVLHDVSFAVERGEYVALVGPSGAGKSTVAGLLAGLYRPTDGDVLADGTPITQFDADDWRSRVAVVRQDPHVFNETLRYNLTVGNRDASDAEIREACETAQVTEYLDSLPEGYETVLGDNGVRLSGGQRQRLSLARALLKDAEILVLDEATSELDSRLENRVLSAIQRLDRDYAVVGIAHRLSTVTGADAIHVMEDGEFVESGTHADLLDRDGSYADLYQSQTEQVSSPSIEAGD